jgi:hypothetical protein
MAKPAFVFNDASRSGDSECENDFDFVFIEKEFECKSNDDDDEDDDADSYDSYDYCEDAISIISNSENDNEVYLLSDSIDDEMTSPTTCLNDSALSVPLVLLKDLDEAHAAAKLTLPNTDLEGISDLVTTCSDDDENGIEVEEKYTSSSPSQQNYTLQETEKEKPKEFEHLQMTNSSSSLSNDNNDCTDIEDSSSPVQSTESSEPNTSTTANGNSDPRNRAIIILPTAETGKKTSPSEITLTTPYFVLANFSQKERTKKEEKQSNGDKNANSINNVVKTTSDPVSTSRTSNKKRRKKLKMLKKAQAAEKFQQQVAFANLSSHGKVSKKLLKHAKKHQHHVTPPRCASKKVANIAVSCAIESMSCYREELSRQQQGTK